MKLMHLSDLHLGKRLHEAPLLEDQAHLLEQVLKIAGRERPDAVLIAGDVYDKTVPPAEAVQLLDRFLSRLADGGFPVFCIAGNHDSAERLSFGSRLMEGRGVHLAPVYEGDVRPVTLADGFGPVDVYLLPFLKPAAVRRCFPDEPSDTYDQAVRTAVAHLPLDRSRRNVLVTHQFVTGAMRSESEEYSVGGTDNVDASAFDGFDYVALGHIHRPQNVAGPRVRYCGTPMAYAFSEAGQEKSVTIAELGAPGALTVRTVPLRPLRALRELRGTYLQLSSRDAYCGTAVEDYLHITLTDEEDVPDAAQKLRCIYPNLLWLDYDNVRTRTAGLAGGLDAPEERSPLELFDAFYARQNGRPMDEAQRELIRTMMENIWGEAL